MPTMKICGQTTILRALLRLAIEQLGERFGSLAEHGQAIADALDVQGCFENDLLGDCDDDC